MPALPPQIAPCFGCLGMSMADALSLSLWDSISQNAAIDPVLDFIIRAGITDQTEIDAVQTLYDSAVANGWWDKCDLIYPFVGGTAQAHAQNLKSSSYTITWSGTVTHDANGITGDSTTGFGDTGYMLSLGPVFSLNYAHLGIYRRNTGNRAQYAAAGNGVGDMVQFSRDTVDTTVISTINSGTSNTSLLTSLAWSMASRSGAAGESFFTGGIENTFLIPSTSVPAITLYVLARNTNGVTTNFSSANISGLTAGSGFTLAEYNVMSADWQTFNTALGRQV